MKKTHVIPALSLIIIITLSHATEMQTTGKFTIPSGRPVRIACIGDSITQGRGGVSPTYSWRYPFWKKLIDAGLDFDLVGSTKTGFETSPDWADYKAKSFDADHEGHWGWHTDGIRDKLPGWLEGYTPDIALIQLGTNDFGDENPVESTKAEMSQVIDILRKDNPEMLILIGLPFNEWKPAPELSDAFCDLAAERTLPNSPVAAVAHGTGWISDPNQPDSHTVDWAHPNLNGDTKIAQAYLEALAPYLNIEITAKPPIAEIKASATTGPAPLTVELNASGSTDPDGRITSFGWQFGDGSNRAGGAKVSHTYEKADTYEVTLGVTDNDSATGSGTITVTVE